MWRRPKVKLADHYEMNISRHRGSVLVPWSFILHLFGHPQIKALLDKLWDHPSLPHTNTPDWCSRQALISNRLFGNHSSPITIIYLTVENCSNCSWSCGATRDLSPSRTLLQPDRTLTQPANICCCLYSLDKDVSAWCPVMRRASCLPWPPMWAKPSNGMLIVCHHAPSLICCGCDMLAVAAEKSLSIFSEYASTSSDTLPGGPAPFYLLTDMLTEAWGQEEGSKRSGVSLTGQEAQIQPADVSKCSCSRWHPFRKMTLLVQKTTV